jgi:uncharacterized membrane protein YqjE
MATDTPRFGAGRADEPYPPTATRPTSSGQDEAGGSSIAGLLQEIVGDVQGIIRSEVRLAKAEVKEDATSMGKAAGMLVAGAVLGIYALGILLLCIIYALNGPLPDWVAALIVGLVVAAAAGILAKIGLDRVKSVNPAPDKTIDSVKEDIQWVKQQTR